MIIAALVVSLGLNLFLLMAWHIARRGLAAAQADGANIQRLRQANAELLDRIAKMDAQLKQRGGTGE